MTTTPPAVPAGIRVVYDGPHAYLEPDPAANDPCADACQRPKDLVAYTNRARHPGTRESRRLYQEPAEVVARIEDYVLDVLDLLSETPANG